MAQLGHVKIRSSEAIGNIEVTVKVTGLAIAKCRLKIATLLLRLARCIGGFNLTIK